MTGTAIIHSSAWVSFALWAGAEEAFIRRHNHRARRFWTWGAAVLALHVAAAFQWQHHWSHPAAVRATAEQTAAVIGWRWGGGVWINYALLTVWSADALRWWSRNGNDRTSAPPTALRGVLAFLWFQAAVVFAHGGIRAIAGLVFLGLAIRFVLSRKPASLKNSGAAP
jgi:hypothetical protein